MGPQCKAQSGLVSRLFRTGVVFALLTPAGLTQLVPPPRQQPVGLILAARGARVVKAERELPISAKPGDVLFSGDLLRAAGGFARVLHCPSRVASELDPDAVLVAEPRQWNLRAGRLLNAVTVPACLLPDLDPVPSPSLLDAATDVIRSAGPGQLLAASLSALPAERRIALEADLRLLDAALASRPDDLAARIAKAEVLHRHGLSREAAREYRAIEADWPDASWTRERILAFERAARTQSPDPSPTRPGRTYALLVGISRFQKETIRPLDFPYEDAKLLRDYLRSPRGGEVPAGHIAILSDAQATRAAIQDALQALKALDLGKDDRIVILFASHGTAEGEGRRAQGYIVTWDSDPQDLKTTALPMRDVREFITNDLARVGLVAAFVDVCRAGKIGERPSGRVDARNQLDAASGDADGELFLFAASLADEASLEGRQFGGGHGAFSYFLARALNGDADKDHDGAVQISEVLDYVQTNVRDSTLDRQHPQANFSRGKLTMVGDVRPPGIQILEFTSRPAPAQPTQIAADLTRGVTRLAPAGAPAPSATEREEFEQALTARRLLPSAERNAFQALAKLRPLLRPEQYDVEKRRLRVALEDMGQQVLLQYLTGDQVPQKREDFLAGAAHFSSALLLTDAHQFLESRALFCEGRAALFDRGDYARGIDLLERATRLDPDRAYSYNALGIAYLEQARYADAISAFRDARRRAPFWAYPLHNLALTYTQVGDYDAAIKAYERAMRLAPRYSYLPYSLALVHQRLNRLDEAERLLRRAAALDSTLAEPYNAWGVLKASQGKRSEAERLYRQALSLKPSLRSARHNLAVLLAGEPGRMAEAIGLWQQNLAEEPGHLASRLSLARALARHGDLRQAIREYETVAQARPGYAAVQRELSELHRRTGDLRAALRSARAAATIQPDSAEFHELLGDLEAQTGDAGAALRTYQDALRFASQRSQRNRLLAKLRAVGNSRP